MRKRCLVTGGAGFLGSHVCGDPLAVELFREAGILFVEQADAGIAGLAAA